MSDYGELKVDELQKLLEERGLPKSGKKAELIARLEEHDAAEAESPAPSPQRRSQKRLPLGRVGRPRPLRGASVLLLGALPTGRSRSGRRLVTCARLRARPAW